MNIKPELLPADTRAKLDQISRLLLRLHKSLLDDERAVYEAVHGQIASPHELFRLVLSHAQFTWLGKISSLIALLDEAASVRRPATEAHAQALLEEARLLLKLEGEDQPFIEHLQLALTRSTDATDKHNEALRIATAESE